MIDIVEEAGGVWERLWVVSGWASTVDAVWKRSGRGRDEAVACATM